MNHSRWLRSMIAVLAISGLWLIGHDHVGHTDDSVKKDAVTTSIVSDEQDDLYQRHLRSACGAGEGRSALVDRTLPLFVAHVRAENSQIIRKRGNGEVQWQPNASTIEWAGNTEKVPVKELSISEWLETQTQRHEHLKASVLGEGESEVTMNINPMVVPLSAPRLVDDGHIGASFTRSGAAWHWQPVSWPPANMTALGAGVRYSRADSRPLVNSSLVFVTKDTRVLSVEFGDDFGDHQVAVPGLAAWKRLVWWQCGKYWGVSGDWEQPNVLIIVSGVKFVFKHLLVECVASTTDSVQLVVRPLDASLKWE